MNTRHKILRVLGVAGALVPVTFIQLQAQSAQPQNLVRQVILEEGIKASIGLAFDGLERLIPSVRGLIASRQPSVNAVVDQTYYRLDRTVRYPHQPLVRELFEFRELKSGSLYVRQVWSNGVSGPPRRVVLNGVARTSPPDWAPPLMLNHLSRNCSYQLDGRTHEDRSDETYELTVRATSTNWPRKAQEVRGYVTVVMPHEALFDRCRAAEDEVDMGTPGRPRHRRNGQDELLQFKDVPILFDKSGNGTSAVMRPDRAPNLVEQGGRPPLVTRLAAQHSSVSNTKAF